MARKKHSDPQPDPKPATRASTIASTRAAAPAHPRLLHGFLVIVDDRRPSSGGGNKPAAPASAPATARGTRPAACKREGPCDDAIFH